VVTAAVPAAAVVAVAAAAAVVVTAVVVAATKQRTGLRQFNERALGPFFHALSTLFTPANLNCPWTTLNF
jgi:hypothetical protein